MPLRRHARVPLGTPCPTDPVAARRRRPEPLASSGARTPGTDSGVKGDTGVCGGSRSGPVESEPDSTSHARAALESGRQGRAAIEPCQRGEQATPLDGRRALA